MGTVLSPSRDVLIEEVCGVDIGVNSMISAPANTVLVRMLGLIEFFHYTCGQHVLGPNLDLLGVGVTRPVLLSFIESVVRVVGEVEIPGED